MLAHPLWQVRPPDPPCWSIDLLKVDIFFTNSSSMEHQRTLDRRYPYPVRLLVPCLDERTVIHRGGNFPGGAARNVM